MRPQQCQRPQRIRHVPRRLCPLLPRQRFRQHKNPIQKVRQAQQLHQVPRNPKITRDVRGPRHVAALKPDNQIRQNRRNNPKRQKIQRHRHHNKYKCSPRRRHPILRAHSSAAIPHTHVHFFHKRTILAYLQGDPPNSAKLTPRNPTWPRTTSKSAAPAITSSGNESRLIPSSMHFSMVILQRLSSSHSHQFLWKMSMEQSPFTLPIGRRWTSTVKMENKNLIASRKSLARRIQPSTKSFA